VNGLIRWFAANGVAANCLMLLIIALGVAGAMNVKRELLPAATLDVVRVSVVYPGATPSEVEDGIVLRIEEAVGDLPGIEKMTATAAEGLGSVTLEVDEGFDVRELLNDVKSRVDGIRNFPLDAEKPQIEAPVLQRSIIGLAVYGDLSTAGIRQVAERVRDDLLAIPGLTQVTLSAAPDYEIAVEISEADLRRYGLSFAEVSRAVSQASLDLPAGSIKRQGGEILLRAKGQAYRGEEFARLVLRTDANGGVVRLGDVARVRDAFADVDLSSRFNGHPAVLVSVSQVGNQDILHIARSVRDYLEHQTEHLPPSVNVAIYEDTSVLFRERVDTLVSNAVSGLILVFVALALFLRLRLAFWVTLGIPLSFLGALWVMPMANASINMISLFAFILVLGIVVDDAIVVSEAVHTDQQNGIRGAGGAVSGTLRVAAPVFLAVSTTLIAFVPMLMISGVDGAFWRLIPIVVMSVLTFSLIESLFILPAHLTHGGEIEKPPARWSPLGLIRRGQDAIERGLFRFIDHLYLPLLRTALTWRYATVALFLAMITVVVGVVGGGLIRFTGFPVIAGDSIIVQVEMPNGSHVSATEQVLARVTDGIARLRPEFDGADPARPVIGDVLVTIGATPGSAGRMGHGRASGGSGQLAEVLIKCNHLRDLNLNVRTIQRRLEELVGTPPGVKKLTFTSDLGNRGNDIAVRLVGADLDRLRAASRYLQDELLAIDGVYRAQDDYADGKEELIMRVTPAGQTLGVTQQDLGRQVRQAFYGDEVQRILRGRDEVKVMVRYTEPERRRLDTLENMRVRTASGAEVPFSTVATVERATSFPNIRRQDRRRVVELTADVDQSRTAASSVNAVLTERLFPDLATRFPGVSASFSGTVERQGRVYDELAVGFAIALFGMYAVMAIAFRSYLQPVLIMTAIPFGIVGAILGHLLTGHDLSMLSILGIIALSGVVVNDNLVLIDAINELRARGTPLMQAILTGARSRFRAVMLTTLTTFVGLVPLLGETSVQAQFLIPMAVSLAFGVLFATGITLLLVPIIYLALEDVRAAVRWVFVGERLDPDRGPPVR
jgi:multidrug efflux pump subunit AcrB